MKAWIKAGLIGGAVSIVLTAPVLFMFFLPVEWGLVIGSLCSLVYLLLYPGVGMLAAFWSPRPRTLKQGALAGALAGLLAFVIDSLATVCFSTIVALTGGFQEYIYEIFARYFSPFRLFLNARMLSGLDWAIIAGVICASALNVVMGTLFSCLGGLIFSAIVQDKPSA
jgi:uncharacterized protein YggT (Ycf19 family)